MRVVFTVLSLLAAVPVSAEGWQPQVLAFRQTESTPPPARPALNNWDARIEYGIESGATDLPGAFTRGDERGWSKAVFATLQRRFPASDVTPYLGVGAGYAAGLVTDRSKVAVEALAFKGVFGTEMDLEQGLGAFVEYSFAVSPNAQTGPSGTLRSHALNTGFKLELN